MYFNFPRWRSTQWRHKSGRWPDSRLHGKEQHGVEIWKIRELWRTISPLLKWFGPRYFGKNLLKVLSLIWAQLVFTVEFPFKDLKVLLQWNFRICIYLLKSIFNLLRVIWCIFDQHTFPRSCRISRPKFATGCELFSLPCLSTVTSQVVRKSRS